VFRHVLAGAGGWGDPLERDPAAVLRDVRNELLSPQKALADYGVVVDTTAWTVDSAATARCSRGNPPGARLDRDAQGPMARACTAAPRRRVTPWLSLSRRCRHRRHLPDIVLLGFRRHCPYQEDLVQRRQLRPGDRRRLSEVFS